MSRIRLIAAIITLTIYLAAEAHAGVLIRSSRVRSTASARTPRVTLGRTRKSTAGLARLNPLRKVTPLGSTEDLQKIVKSQQKYQKDLARWEKKRLGIETRHKRKLDRKKRKEEKRRKKLAEARLKKAQKLKAKQAKAATEGKEVSDEQGESGSLITKKDKGASVENSNGKKPSFWTRFWRSLIGTK